MSAKATLKRVLPTGIVHVGSKALDRSLPGRRRNRARERRYARQARVCSELIARDGAVVQGGPFKGLHLPRGVWGNPAPLFVGSYEAELHGLIEAVIAAQPVRVINVGCAEGYYAVGLARRLTDADVHAFDIDDEAQRVVRETAQANGVAERVKVAGKCTTDT